MKCQSFRKSWMVLPMYLLGGLALGLADRQFRPGVQVLGLRPGLATAVSVNVLLPMLAIALGVAYPRLSRVWIGALGMTVAFILGLAFNHARIPAWNVGTLLGSVPPVLVIACLGYAILGTVAALLARRLRSDPAQER